MATKATTETFDHEVTEADGRVLVDFWAEWCGPCHAVEPVITRIADEHAVKLVKVNIDEEQALALRFGVQSIPTIILFEDGRPSASAIGAMPKGTLERQLGLVAAA
jgi:thioredoxin 1